MHVELDQGLVADAAEAMDLAGLDDQDVAGTSFELLAVDGPETPTSSHELNFIVRVAVGTGAAAGQGTEEKRRDVHVAIVGADELVGAALEGEVLLLNSYILSGARRLLRQHDQVRDEALDLAIFHFERIAEDCFENTTAFPRRTHATLGHNDVVLLDQSCNPHGGAAGERIVLDLTVECFLASHMKCAGHHPLDVIAQARKNLGMIASVEAIDVSLDGALIRAHELSPDN